MVETFYWLAINGASCAGSFMPMPSNVIVTPTPELLIGYKSREEQLAAQRFFLTAPIKEVEKYMKKDLMYKFKNGEVKVIQPSNPEPPTTGQTLWMSQPSAETDPKQ